MSKNIKFNIPYYGNKEYKNIKNFLDKNQDFKELAIKHIQKVTNATAVLLSSGATSAMDAFFA